MHLGMHKYADVFVNIDSVPTQNTNVWVSQ